jgi:hypothetical protein
MQRLDTATRNIVIGCLQAGELQNAVARLYNVHRSTISRLLHQDHISSPRSLHPGSSPEKPDRDSKRVDADVSVLRQSKDVWRVSHFRGDGF